MSNSKAKTRIARILTALIIVMMVWTAMPVNMWQAHAEQTTEPAILETNKDTYDLGEPIMVTANQAAEKSWVGLYAPYDKQSRYYFYVNEHAGGIGKAYDLLSGEEQYGHIAEGTYEVRLYEDYDGKILLATKNITIGDPNNKPVYTDKKTYDVGEDILLTTNFNGVWDWVTIFENGKDPYSSDYEGWYWASEVTSPYNIITATGELAVGEYSAYLFSYAQPNDGTGDDRAYCVGYADFVVEHQYGDWDFDGEDAKTHTRVCTANDQHIDTDNCSWNEGETLADGSGIKYTCTVCGGSYVETHEFEYEFNAEEKTHTKTCTKHENCSENGIEDCDFNEEAYEDGKVTLKCGQCKGTQEKSVLTTDKKEYALGTPIKVTAYSEVSGAWVGIYAPGDQKSRYWYDVGTVGSGNSFDIFQSGNLGGKDYGEAVYPIEDGTYTVKLWEGSTAVAQQEITVGDPSDNHIYVEKNTFDIGEPISITTDCNTNSDWVAIYKIGENNYINWWYPSEVTEPFNALDKTGELAEGNYAALLYADGASNFVIGQVGFKVKHTFDGDWIYDGKDANTHHKVCDGVNKHSTTPEKCNYVEEVTTAPTNDTEGVKTFTCTVCNGFYTETIPSLSDTIVDIVETEATCTEPAKEITTYASGKTSEKVLKDALGHDYGKPVYNEDQKTHTAICERDGCTEGTKDHKKTFDCDFATTSENGKTKYICNECGASFEKDIIELDKKVYDLDEAINITVNYPSAEKDWIGLYKRDVTPALNGIQSYYYYYPEQVDKTFNIYDGTQQHSIEEPGEYKLVFLKNDGYEQITSVDIIIDHTYGECTPTADRTDKDKCQHIKVCEVNPTHKEKVNCSFDEGVETKAPTITETGELTFTCAECGGTFVEVIPAKGDKVVSEETTPATCEKPSIKTTTYESGIVKTEEVAPALGHDYDETTGTFDEATKTHRVTCKNDDTHVKYVDCSFETTAVDGNKVTHKCTVCEGSFDSGLLFVDKDTYTTTDVIRVIAACAAKDSWVGLYGVDDRYDPNNQGVHAYNWYYIIGKDYDWNGKLVNLTDHNNIDARPVTEPGEYKVVLFGDEGYSNILDEKFITITESTTTYDVKVNGEAVEDGSEREFEVNEKVKVNVTANGSAGRSWVGIYPGEFTKDFDFSSTSSAQYYFIGENNGKDVELQRSLIGEGVHTIVVFGDGGHKNVKHISYYNMPVDYESEKILKEPTCTEPGQKEVVYRGETESKIVPIPALGHDLKLTFDAETKTHSGVCQRGCGYSADKEDCTFDEGVEADYIKTYTCKKCDGQYTEELERPYNEETDRIYGDTRYETAIKTADQLKSKQKIEKFQAVIVADGNNYADALSGTYLGKVKSAPILLVNSNSKNHNMKQIADYIKANLAEEGTVYILGGKNAVSDKFEVYFKDNKFKISRLGGANRYDTNLLILKEAGITGNEIIVCTGNDFADSLSASAAAKPILLVNNKELTASQVKFLKGMKNMKFYIIGGTVAISTKMAAKIRDYGGTERIYGDTRYETSVKIAERLFDNPKSIVLAYGKNFPDGLAGGILAMQMNAPLILTIDGKTQFVTDYAKKNGIVSGVVLGGSGLISSAAAQGIFAAANQK